MELKQKDCWVLFKKVKHPHMPAKQVVGVYTDKWLADSDCTAGNLQESRNENSNVSYRVVKTKLNIVV